MPRKKNRVVYLDVDGVFIVPSKPRGKNQHHPHFVRAWDDEMEVEKGFLPTAKQSWGGTKLTTASQAVRCLQLLSLHAELRFLTGHPEWSVKLLLKRLACIVPCFYVDWQSVSCKGEAIAKGDNWVWIEDDLKPGDSEWLSRHRLYGRYVSTDKNVGIRISHVQTALEILGVDLDVSSSYQLEANA